LGAFDDLPVAKERDPFADLPTVKLPDRLSTGLIETGANIVSGLGGAAAGGVTALATGDPSAVEPVAEAITYQPRSKIGKEMSGAVQKAFQMLDEFGDWTGEKIRELNPQDPRLVPLAAAVRTLINFIPGLVLPPAMRGLAREKGAEVSRGTLEPAAAPKAGPASPTLPERPFPVVAEETPAARTVEKTTRRAVVPESDPFADLPDAGNLEDVPAFQPKSPVAGYWEGPGGEFVETVEKPTVVERAKELAFNDRRWHEAALTQPERRGVPPALELEGQTPDQVRAEVAAVDRAKAQEARKAGASPSEEFTLSGSDRPADQAAARGQMELQEAPEAVPTKSRKRAEGPPASILTRIKRMGGINIQEILDLTGEGRTGKKGISPGLFTKGGTGLDDLATRLRDEGFDIPVDAADGGVQGLRNMIQDELAGRRKHYSFAEQERVAQLEQDREAKAFAEEEKALDVATRGEGKALTDEQALERYGPGTLGMNAALNPELIRQAARDMKAGAKAVVEDTFGAPGEYRNLYGPIRDLEQTNVARIDRWAAGESHTIKQAFPNKKAREDLTLRIVRGDLSGLQGAQLEVAKRLQQNYAQMGEYALRAEQLDELRQNYSPQIWDINDAHTRRLIQMWRDAREAGPIRESSPLMREPGGSGMFSPFRLQRAISDVFEGMQMGMKPASLDAAELFTTYARSMGRSVERSKAMTSLHQLLSDDGLPMVMPEKQAPRGYERIGYPELEGYRVHPDIAAAVKVVLETDTPGAVGIVLQSAAYASKRGLVSYSFFHPTSLFLAWEGSFPKGSMLNPKGAIDAALKKYREGGPGDAVDKLLASGLKIGAPLEDIMGRERFGRVMDRAERVADKLNLGGLVRVPRKIDRALQHATWDYVQTGFKLDLATRFFEDQLVKNAEKIAKGEITERDIARQAAEAANGIQGGLNWERMIDKFDTPAGRRIMADILSKNGRRWMQTFAFAPDWLVSTISTWTNAVTGGERAAVRQALARRYLITSAIITYTYGNALNYYFTGHSMFENRSGKKDATWLDDMKAKTEVHLGGGLRINPNKHFLEVPHMVADPVQFALNKANPMTVGEPLEQLFNKQWLSTGYAPPIAERSDAQLTRLRKRAQHASGKVLPITGRSVMEHGALGAGGFLGFPVSGVSEEQKENERIRRTIERSARP